MCVYLLNCSDGPGFHNQAGPPGMPMNQRGPMPGNVPGGPGGPMGAHMQAPGQMPPGHPGMIATTSDVIVVCCSMILWVD